MLITNVNVVDPVEMAVLEQVSILIEAGVITAVDKRVMAPEGIPVIDGGGGFVVPGLIDAHSHLGSLGDPLSVMAMEAGEYVFGVAREFELALSQGYTTVRDAGFTDAGFERLRAQGHFKGPRLFASNGPLSITGGHADVRPVGNFDPMPLRWNGLYWPGILVDGVGPARWAAREVLRCGAHQIKVMAGGGCSTETDDIEDVQFSPEELAAIVYEAKSRRRGVAAHALAPDAIRAAASAGVTTIEHGNLLDEESAEQMAESRTALVPTIAAYQLRADEENRHKYPEYFISKIDSVLEPAYEAVGVALEHKVLVGFGSDLGGDLQQYRSRELGYQARASSNLEAIRQATINNATILGLQDTIGRVAPGYKADFILVSSDPVSDISVLEDATNISVVVQDGTIMKDARS